MFRGMAGRIAAAILAVMLAFAGVATPVSAHTLDDSQFTQIPGTMLYVSPGAARNADIHVEEYMSVPINVLTRLVSSNCRIYVDTFMEEGAMSSGTSTPRGTAVVGMFYGTYIDILSEFDVGEQMNLIHEIGHFVDYSSLGGYEATGQAFPASSTEEWQSIWQSEWAAVAALSTGSSVNTYNATEYFATAFAWYVKDPIRLVSVAPRTYAYVNAMVLAIQ